MNSKLFSLENSTNLLNRLDKIERRINLKAIDILFEIEQHKAYADKKYSSLYVYCIKELKYTEAQAGYRINAMYAIKTLPELKTKIENGSISVTNVAQAQSFLRQEQIQIGTKKTKEEKLELFNSFENKTTREVKDSIKILKGERITKKLIIELDDETEHMWNEIKSLTAHQSKGNDLMCLKVLLKNMLNKKNSRRTSSWSNKNSRYIPKPVKIEIMKRDEHQCTNCGSKYALQIEHKIPFSQNGQRNVENLEVLCRSCNLNKGVKQFGLKQMKRL